MRPADLRLVRARSPPGQRSETLRNVPRLWGIWAHAGAWAPLALWTTTSGPGWPPPAIALRESEQSAPRADCACFDGSDTSATSAMATPGVEVPYRLRLKRRHAFPYRRLTTRYRSSV